MEEVWVWVQVLDSCPVPPEVLLWVLVKPGL